MRIIYNVKRRYAIRMEIGDKFLTSLTKLVKSKPASFKIKENRLLHCHKFLAFVVVVIN